MKAYKVSLYKVNYDGFEKGKLIYIDSVIVKKQLIGVKELLTGYDKIDLVNHIFVKNGRLDYASRKPEKAQKYGYHLVVFVESLVPKNEARIYDLDDYVDHYEQSEWKKVYDNMHIIKKDEKKQLSKRIRSIKNIKY